MRSMNPSAIQLSSAITRWLGLLMLWLLIAGTNPSDFPAGMVAAGLASWASLILHPPGARGVRLVPLTWLGLSVLLNSVVAGFDIAWRALDPKLPLNPGVVRYAPDLPEGPARAVFSTIASLVPGTLPMGSAPDGTLLVHCLDTAQPVAASLARDEAALRRSLNEVQTDG
jgi:multicomponent Na+:H+ antiporter subunit E